MTQAVHSGGFVGEDSITYLAGDPAGSVIEAENGTKLYFAGDTDVFGDMELIGRLYEPDVAILPIGDHFVDEPGSRLPWLPELLDASAASRATTTFPVLTGTPDELRALAPDVEVIS